LLNRNLDLSLLHLQLPCPEQGAAQGEGLSWQTQDGRVRSLAFLSILLRYCTALPPVLVVEFVWLNFVVLQPLEGQSGRPEEKGEIPLRSLARMKPGPL
jgi:hypothetical protein